MIRKIVKCFIIKDYNNMRRCTTIICFFLLLLASCSKSDETVVDRLNEKSYDFHYRSLDSTRIYADSALSLSNDYSAGQAEALNNLAFVETAAMNYGKAKQFLDSIQGITNNQIELLISDVQQMKLCQKQSHNKDFYVYSAQAKRRLVRIKGEASSLNEHEQRRYAYALSEFHIVSSIYYYYTGLQQQSSDQMTSIDPYGTIQRDTAQLLNYWYNIGAGGIIMGKDKRKLAQTEMGYLAQCYILSAKYHYPYWEAQSLQAISEHLQDGAMRKEIIYDNIPTIVAVNTDMMPDSLIAGNLAQRALNLFKAYGDVYQTAGGWRTLGECFWHIGDNRSALICLNHALEDNKKVEQAPDLIASIREDLCLVYSAVNDKQKSDYNRNIYLDLQEQTRQDRQLEARAAELKFSIHGLNLLIAIVILMIILVTVLLIVFAQMRRKSDDAFSISRLLAPLSEWQKHNEEAIEHKREHFEEIEEATDVARLHLQQNKQRNLEQRAKVQLVCSILPLIDRMVNEVKRLKQSKEARSDEQTGNERLQIERINNERLKYVEELTDSINQYNNILTKWIQMRQGELSLKIENFQLQKVFDIVSHSAMSFSLNGIRLIVKPTDAVVKADSTLTLFMVNTIADNARKFTPKGGTVTIEAKGLPQKEGERIPYIEISITDNGKGMDKETLSHIFDQTYTGGHGFGLKNCRGIIEKYKKISSLFSQCLIDAESTVGKGTRIFFRLPVGKIRMIVAAFMISVSCAVSGGTKPANNRIAAPAKDRRATPAKKRIVTPAEKESKAAMFADSAYLSNILGNYTKTLRYADSCRKYIQPADTTVLLDVSNEAAIAALALHQWDLYQQNNDIYTKLFRQASADNSLPSYIQYMQRSKTNKMVSVVLLIILLLVIFPAWYFLYYRHKLNYKFCVERINKMNDILLSNVSDEEKLMNIRELEDFNRFNLTTDQKRKLHNVVEKIESALLQNIAHSKEMDTEAELANDELQRIDMESGRLHVSNNVLDNCLSTLKHETMFYPSRIKQMVDSDKTNIDELGEVINYYHDLYAILAEQALRQVVPQRMSQASTGYLLDILKKCNGNRPIQISELPIGTGDRQIPKKYVSLHVTMSALGSLTDEQTANLFTPYSVDLNLLLCRQIVREMGEATNLRACGIEAGKDKDGNVIVKILIPKIFYNE